MAVDESPDSPVPSIGPNQYRLLVEGNLVGIGIVQDERLRHVNPKFAEIHGYRREELIGESVFEVIDEEDVERARGHLRRWRSETDPEGRYEITGQRKDGTRIHVELQARREALERENERLDRFASVVSHDLRSPLTVANGELELARESCDSPRLDEIETSLTRMEAMIQDLLAMAREGQIVDDGELSAVDLDAIARDAWQQVSTSKAELVAESGLDAVADSDRIKHVFENLFCNSIEHGFLDDSPGAEDESGGLTVRVGALLDEDETGFFVEDDGIGIPESEREPVFDPGYSTDPEGTGFGLMIVEDVVNAHGWTIRLTQSEEGGARFEISDVDLA